MSKADDPSRDLATPVQFLKGGGPERAKRLAKIGLRTARDLVFHLPRSYEDLTEIRTIATMVSGETNSIVGVVEESNLREIGPERSILTLLLKDDQEYLRCTWFNQPFLHAKLSPGQRLLVSGTAKLKAGRWEMTHPTTKVLGDSVSALGQVIPVYSLTEGVNQTQMRRLVHLAVDECSEMIPEVFPEFFLQEKNLLGIGEALREIHGPQSMELLELARQRLIYQELLILQLAVAMQRERMQSSPAPQMEVSPKVDARIRRRFPFQLTDDQNAAIDDIVADLTKSFPMNRLLQGEVGSGKTVVAEYAMLASVAVGRQAVLMAPTDVLARQHLKTLKRDLAESQVAIGMLTGSLTAAQRRDLIERTAENEIDIIVGTQAIAHALESKELRIPKLGLVIIDEQHKFGVRQRAQLKQAGVDAHYLVMTATPIPRTVAISLFGELDVSSLRQAPPGRQPVRTYISEEGQREQWWEFFRRKLDEGRQGYVVVPLVEENDESDGMVRSLQQAFEELASDRLESYRLDLIHGRMGGAEKEDVMAKFHRGETQVLVATTVVEVGVDVPNATLMTIENGERFGLAQLHQLRGRISRGVRPGYLCVFASPENEQAGDRLAAFAETNDGFELAEIDFNLRGPGDMFGVRQHGLPPFRIANLQRDAEVVLGARGDARRLVANDPELRDDAWRNVREMVIRRFGDALDLGDVG